MSRWFFGFMVAAPLAACVVEDVSFSDGSKMDAGSEDASAAADGNVVGVEDGSVSPTNDSSADAADARPAMLYERVESSAGSAGQGCNTKSCNNAQHCCVAANPNENSCPTIGLSCNTAEADFKCDDPFDCAPRGMGCCATTLNGLIVGSSCQATSCAIWFCVTQPDCPSGTTCQQAPAAAPPSSKTCLP